MFQCSVWISVSHLQELGSGFEQWMFLLVKMSFDFYINFVIGIFSETVKDVPRCLACTAHLYSDARADRVSQLGSGVYPIY